MGRNKIVIIGNVSRFKALAFLGSYLWNIEQFILQIQVQERVGEFEAW